MIFMSKKKKILIENDITISGSKIEQVEATKFLGVYLDAKLSWNYHINYCSGNVAKPRGEVGEIGMGMGKTLLQHCQQTSRNKVDFFYYVARLGTHVIRTESGIHL